MLALGLAACLPAFLSAADQQFAFALPEAEGRISLGVFDGNGKLVRTLYQGASEKDFKIGLNGLLGTWDGKNDAGQALPAGKYGIRGWLVADTVKAEGVAFHFNDWIVDDSSPEISGIGALVPRADKYSTALFGYRPSRSAVGHTDACRFEMGGSGSLALFDVFPRRASFLAGNPKWIAISDPQNSKLIIFPPVDESGFAATMKKPAPDSFDSGAFWKGNLYALNANPEAKALSAFKLHPADEPQNLTPPPGTRGLDANEAALIAWGKKSISLCREGEFVVAPIAELRDEFHLSAGIGETLWIAGFSGEDIVVRQYSFGGELLREMKIPRENFTEALIFAGKDSPSFYLVLRSDNWARQTVRAYRPAAASEAASAGTSQPVDWEVFLDKTIENSRRFGLKDGNLVANAGDAPQKTERKIDLPDDALTGKKSSITLKALTLPSGLWLATAEGLPLVRLTDTATFDRFVLAAGEGAGSLRLFAGNGVVVAEYLLSGLEGLAAIDAGEVDLP